MTPKTRRLQRIQMLAVTFLVIAGLVNYLDRSTLSIANRSIAHELNLSATQMGLLLSAFSLAYAFSQLPVGAMLDRFGARVMLGFGMFAWSCAQVAGGLVTTFQQFFIARIFLGIGEAPQFPAGAKVISEWFNARERGGPTGIFTASSTIAPMLAPPLLTFLMLGFGWRIMFVIMGTVGVAVSIGWYLIYRNRGERQMEPEEVRHLSEGEEGHADNAKVSFAEWRGLFAKRTTWGMILGFMGVIYMFWLYLTWLPAYLEHERHLSIAKTGWLVSIPYAFGTLGVCISGFLADWLVRKGMSPVNSRKWPICVGLFGAAAFTVPAAFTPSTSLAIAYICGAMFFVNLASGGAWALVSVAAPRRLVASLGSMQNFGGYLGGSLAPLITGMVVDRTQSFVVALLISAAVAVVAALIYLFLVSSPISSRELTSSATQGAF